MIQIIDKNNCCGCEACVQVCPKGCIDFTMDTEGFYYPHVNVDDCVSCGMCEKVCPMLNPCGKQKSISVYGAFNKNEEVRKHSSSGGIFTLLAEKVLDDGGVVFGAKFDKNWDVVYAPVFNKKDLCLLRGSKYVQARVGNNYKLCKEYLDHNRKVLFTGTPCHISGLLHFLRRDYDNLLTCDVFCHGVPSPGVWNRYLSEVAGKGRDTIERIDFRNKKSGWKNYSVVIKTQSNTLRAPYRENPYMRAFLNDLILRPSCYSCKSKEGRSHSDITIADFWGIEHLHPEIDDDKGISLVLLNTNKGVAFFETIESHYVFASFLPSAVEYNPAYIYSAELNKNREVFFRGLADNTSMEIIVNKALHKSTIIRLKIFVRRIIAKLFR